jgi:putative alpha-1,2-mannosidase
VVHPLAGDHCGVLIGDAFQKGLMKDQSDELARNAYNAMRKNALDIPSGEEYLEGKGRRAIKEYLTAGFVPLEATMPLTFHSREQVIERDLMSALSVLLRSKIVCFVVFCFKVSRTMEYAYNDYVVAQLAKQLGYQSDYEQLLQHSESYKMVIDDKGMQ